MYVPDADPPGWTHSTDLGASSADALGASDRVPAAGRPKANATVKNVPTFFATAESAILTSLYVVVTPHFVTIPSELHHVAR
jgi:hypothetical protein